MDFLQGLNGHLGVDLSGFQAGVTRHLLDEADIGAAFEHGVEEKVVGVHLFKPEFNPVTMFQGLLLGIHYALDCLFYHVLNPVSDSLYNNLQPRRSTSPKRSQCVK